jgi:hypothetical protein
LEATSSEIYSGHRWARLLEQQTLITVYSSPTKENKLAFSVFCLQKTNGSVLFPFSLCSKQTEGAVSVSSIFHIYINIETAADVCTYMLTFLMENGNPGDFS